MAKGIFLSIMGGAAKASKYFFRNAEYLTRDTKAAAESIFLHVPAPSAEAKNIGKNIFGDLEASAAKQLERFSNPMKESEAGGFFGRIIRRDKEATRNIKSRKVKPNRKALQSSAEFELKGHEMPNEAAGMNGRGGKVKPKSYGSEAPVSRPDNANTMGKGANAESARVEKPSRKAQSAKGKNTIAESESRAESARAEKPSSKAQSPKGKNASAESASRAESARSKNTRHTSNNRTERAAGKSTTNNRATKKTNGFNASNNNALMSKNTIKNSVTKAIKSALGAGVSMKSGLANKLVEQCLRNISGGVIRVYSRNGRAALSDAARYSISLPGSKYNALRRSLSKKHVQEMCQNSANSAGKSNKAAQIKRKMLKAKSVRAKSPFTGVLINSESGVSEVKSLRRFRAGQASEQKFVLMLNSDAVTLEEAVKALGERGAFGCIFKNPALLRKYEREAINYIMVQNKVDDLVKLANSSRAIELILNFNRIDHKKELYKCLEKKASSLQKYMFKDTMKSAA